MQSFAEKGITPDMIENVRISDKGQMAQIKYCFRAKFENVMTNVLKLALLQNEEKLSCIITAYYEVNLDEDMIIKALATDKYEWLKFVWAFNKNYIGKPGGNDTVLMGFQHLFDMIKKQHQFN